MKKWLLAAGLLCVVHSAAALSIGDYEKQRDSENTQAFRLTRIYLTGVVAGYIWANSTNAGNKAPLLFCQPPPVTTDLDVPRLLDEEIGQVNVKSDYPAELILLGALVRAFPCDSPADHRSE
ncbi:MAG: hypothetical protein ABSF50_12510 [Burkholderiaceae bacterium]|jgi:hypothetical protein